MASVLVPFDGSSAAEYALEVACCGAVDTGDEVRVAYVIRIPYQLPIHAEMTADRVHADEVFERAYEIATRYNAHLTTLIVEARELGPAIVEAARDCDCIMIGQRARRRLLERFRFNRALRYIMAHAPCQVLVSYEPTTKDAASQAQQFVLVGASAAEQAPDNVRMLPGA